MDTRGFLAGNQDIEALESEKKIFSAVTALTMLVGAGMCFIAIGSQNWQKTAATNDPGLDARVGFRDGVVDMDNGMATFIPLPTCNDLAVVAANATSPQDAIPMDMGACKSAVAGRRATEAFTVFTGLQFSFAMLLALRQSKDNPNGTRYAQYFAIAAGLTGALSAIILGSTRDPNVDKATVKFLVNAMTVTMGATLNDMLKALENAPLQFSASMFALCLTSFSTPFGLIGLCCGFTNPIKSAKKK